MVVRRYYQREPFADIGRSLGISAEAARIRVSRILDQCRAALAGGVWTDPALSPDERHRTERVSKRTLSKVRQMQAMRFAVMTAEFYVKSVEDNLDFFEKLGFRRHFVEAPDSNGPAPRASLRGGTPASG